MFLKPLKPLLPLRHLFFRPFSLFSVEADNSPILDTASDSLISEKPLSKPLVSQSIEGTHNHPKWMRFFTASDPLKIDLERSIKTENHEMIVNYVRLNYLSFDFKQLVIALEKRLRPDLSERLFQEIKLRIAMDAEQKSPEVLVALLDYSVKECIDDDLLSNFLTTEILQTTFDETLPFVKITLVMRFLFAMNVMEVKTLEDYLVKFSAWKKNGKLSACSLKELNNLVIVVEDFHKIMEKKDFEQEFEKTFMDALFKEFLARIESPDHYGTLRLNEIELAPNPTFFSFEQKNQYKIAIARILFEKLNEENNFGRFNANKKDKYSCQKYFLSHFAYPDRYLLRETLQLFCQSLLKDQSQRRNPSIFPIMAHFSIISPFFFNENLSYLQNNMRKHSDFQGFMLMRAYFEMNYDDVLAGPSGNEYLRTSWELLNRNLIEMLANFFNGGKKEKFLRYISEQLRGLREKSDLTTSTLNQSEPDYDPQFQERAVAKLAKYKEYLAPLPRLRNFNRKIHPNGFSVFKALLLKIDLMKNLAIRHSKKSLPLSDYFQNFINEPEILEFIRCFPMIPSLAENLLFLDDFYQLKMKKSLFKEDSEEIKILREIKKEIDNFFNSHKNPLDLLQTLQKRAIDDSIQSEWMSTIYFSHEEVHFFKGMKEENLPKDTKQGRFKFGLKIEDIYSEKFRVSAKTINNKVIYSKMLYFLLNESLFKRLIWDALNGDPVFIGLKENFSDFPAFCDFTFEYNGKKFALFVADHEKLLLGAEGVVNPFIGMCKNYFENKGYKTVVMNYQDYDFELAKIKDLIKMKLYESFKGK